MVCGARGGERRQERVVGDEEQEERRTRTRSMTKPSKSQNRNSLRSSLRLSMSAAVGRCELPPSQAQVVIEKP